MTKSKNNKNNQKNQTDMWKTLTAILLSAILSSALTSGGSIRKKQSNAIRYSLDLNF
ncbi:MAG: hypothetical protein WAJ93_08945 [Candidatus Nitrosopolaris sp.]|jgi:hypothetical protein